MYQSYTKYYRANLAELDGKGYNCKTVIPSLLEDGCVDVRWDPGESLWAFFSNPLEDFESKKPDFEPEIDSDFDLEEDCLSCGKQYDIHSPRDIVQCKLNELRSEIQKG